MEIEARRKAEEELAKKFEKDQQKNQAEYQKKLKADEEEQKKHQRILEQEKLDYELALRLAPETNGEVDPVMAIKKYD